MNEGMKLYTVQTAILFYASIYLLTGGSIDLSTDYQYSEIRSNVCEED